MIEQMTDNEIKSIFQELEDNLNSTFEKNDVNKLSELLADYWTILEPNIGIVRKDDFIKTIKEGKLQHHSMKKEVILVKVFDNTALVISRGRNVGKYLEEPYNTELWVTNIYKRENSKWLCISTQEAPVMCKL